MKASIRESDTVLIGRARAGDREAFGTLVGRYQNMVLATAVAQLGRTEDVHDVAQEAFLVSFESLVLLRQGRRFAPWLHSITWRLCKRWQRSEAYRRTLKEALGRHGLNQATVSPETILEAKEDGVILKEAIERLPRRLREAIVLHCLRGHSLADTARYLGVSRAAATKRVQRAKERLREHVAARVEAQLRRLGPPEDFIERTLAAIPAGSICAKLGINVTRIGIAEALSELAQSAIHELPQAAAQHATTIFTGGITVTVTKGSLTAAAVVLLAVAGAGYLVVRYGRVSPQPTTPGIETPAPLPPAAPPSPDTGSEMPSHPRVASSEPLTVEQVKEFLLKGSPELNQMDEEARLETVRHLLRDLMERSMSLELMRDLRELAEQLHIEGGILPLERRQERQDKFSKALAIYLALYDVASTPENYVWAAHDAEKTLMSDFERLDGILSAVLGMCVSEVPQVLSSLQREADIKPWKTSVLNQINAIPEDVGWGVDRAMLLLLKSTLQFELQLQAEGKEERQGDWDEHFAKLDEEVVRFLGSYLQKDDLTPQDRWLTTWALAERLSSLEKHGEAVPLLKQCWEDAEVHGFDAVNARVRFECARGELALAALPAEKQSKTRESMSNITQISYALQRYAWDHGQTYPGDLEELVHGGYLEAEGLTDPLTGKPYQYTAGFGPETKEHKVLVRTQDKNGMWVCLYAVPHKFRAPVLIVSE